MRDWIHALVGAAMLSASWWLLMRPEASETAWLTVSGLAMVIGYLQVEHARDAIREGREVVTTASQYLGFGLFLVVMPTVGLVALDAASARPWDWISRGALLIVGIVLLRIGMRKSVAGSRRTPLEAGSFRSTAARSRALGVSTELDPLPRARELPERSAEDC